MMHAITLAAAMAFTAWMIYKANHWWDDYDVTSTEWAE